MASWSNMDMELPSYSLTHAISNIVKLWQLKNDMTNIPTAHSSTERSPFMSLLMIERSSSYMCYSYIMITVHANLEIDSYYFKWYFQFDTYYWVNNIL